MSDQTLRTGSPKPYDAKSSNRYFGRMRGFLKTHLRLGAASKRDISNGT